MGYTDPVTAVAGQKLTAVQWNTTVRDSMIDVAKPARCRVERTASQSIPNGGAAVSWTSEIYDTANMWAVGQPTRLIAPVAGTYRMSFGAQFAISAVGVRVLYVIRNGLIKAALPIGPTGAWYAGGCVVTDDVMAAGDYFECMAYQNTGGALNLDIGYPIWAALTLISR